MKNNNNPITLMCNVYGNENCITDLSIVTKDEGKSGIIADFSMFGIKNHCEIMLSEHRDVIHKQCNCHWFEDYNNCPHIEIAHKLVMEEHREMNPIRFHNDKLDEIENKINNFQNRLMLRNMKEKAISSKHLLNKFVKIYDTQLKLSVDETQYEIEPVFSDKYNEWELSFKVGKEKKYVIKSITDFLHHIDVHSDVTYGKKLNFVHSEEAFDDTSLRTIQFIRKHMSQYQSTSNYDTNIKSFHLEENILDDFFLIYENSDDYAFALETIESPVSVKVSEQGEYYIFHLDVQRAFHFGSKHIYYSELIGNSSILYRILLDEEGIASLFIKQLQEEDLIIAKEDYPKFYKYVLLNVMQYIVISLPQQLADERMERAELYGDIDEQNRIFFYLYCYNDTNNRYRGFDANKITSYNQDLIEAYIRKYATTIDEKAHIVYMDENDDTTINFISEGLPYLSKYCEIFVSETLKSLGKSKSYNIQIGVRYSNNLLEFDISSIDIPKEELSTILSAYKKKKKFFRLKNGKLLSLQSDDLDELSSFLDEYHVNQQDLKKGKFSMDAYRMFSVEQSVNDQKLLNIQREKSFEKHIKQYFEAKEHPLPKRYDSILRDYQKDGFQWLSLMRQYNFNGILADDMGLGKTLQVIALLEANKSEQCSIVICPASLIYSWEDEVHKFTNGLSVLCITGSQEERLNRIQKHKEYNLIITSYDYIRRDIAEYEEIVFDSIILDEAQYIKNQKTKSAVSVKQLKAVHKVALSGTPIENSLAELWSIFDFLMPNYLFNYHYFQKHFENAIVKNNDEQKQKALRDLVSPFILRRNKTEVLKELPEKIENVRLIEFNEEEKKLYLANVALVNKELNSMNDSNNNKFEILAMLTKLRQLCCEPRLVYENIDTMSSKLSDCMELIEELHENKQKILLFSTFTSILDLLAIELKRKHISYYMLTGQTNKEERKALVQKFQNDDTCVFLISLKAGGTGLNLTAAEAVIHYDPWWNQSAQNQATDRAYRIGQNRNVQVFKMIVKDSIEEKILKLQDKKKELADAFVENNEGKITSMSKDEIMELFTA